jgi:hypothetical protein
MAEVRNAYRILVGNPEKKRPLGRLSRRWDDNIKMGFMEIRWGVVNHIYLVQDRDQWDHINTVINFWV